MRKVRAMLAVALLLSLAACGEVATAVPTAAPTATVVPTQAAPTTAAVAPFILTITAAVLPTQPGGATPTPTLTASPVTPTPAAAPSSSLPVYSGLKPIDLGFIGTQITGLLSQSSTTARSAAYYTSDTFDKLAAYYNVEVPKLGFTKVAEQELPASAGLNGNVVLYSKGSGIDAEVIALMDIGPLDPSFVSTLSIVSPSAAGLKAGDSLVIVLSGLTGKNLIDLQSTLGGNNGAPAAATPTTAGATPTK